MTIKVFSWVYIILHGNDADPRPGDGYAYQKCLEWFGTAEEARIDGKNRKVSPNKEEAGSGCCGPDFGPYLIIISKELEEDDKLAYKM